MGGLTPGRSRAGHVDLGSFVVPIDEPDEVLVRGDRFGGLRGRRGHEHARYQHQREAQGPGRTVEHGAPPFPRDSHPQYAPSPHHRPTLEGVMARTNVRPRAPRVVVGSPSSSLSW